MHHKGDGNMNSKNSLLKLVFTSLTCLLVMTACLTGCGGANPSGSDTATPITPPSVLPSLATGTAQLIGSLRDSSTGNLINNANASIVVKAQLIGTSNVETYDASTSNNQAFAFYNLAKGGYYLIIASDTAGIFELKSEIIELNANTQLNMSLTPVVIPAASTNLNFFGVVKDSLNQAPVMAATIKVVNNAGQTYQTTSLSTGQFAIPSLASGTYTITITKNGFREETRTLILDNTIRIDRVEVTTTGTFTDGTDTDHPGYYELGTITLAPIWTNTGSLQGILYYTNIDGDKAPLDTTDQSIYLKLWHDENPRDEYAPGIIYDWLTTNTLGYFSMKSLPAGYYMISTSANAPIPVTNNNGDIIGYNITGAVTKMWMEVIPGSVTLIPVQEEE